jgi:hypothetical protein
MQSTIKGYTGTFNFGESTASTAKLPVDTNWLDASMVAHDGSLIRFPDGKSTGLQDKDLQQTETPTPGFSNVAVPYPMK